MEFKALDNERWVWAKTFKGDYPNYLVSDMGRCWSIKRNKFVGGWVNDHWCVCLSKSNKPEGLMIGRLMLISFDIPIPNHLKELPTSKLEAMHLDGDSHNNNLENFAWGSHLENCNEDNFKRRLSEALKGEKHPMYGKFGKEHPRSKPILQYTKDGEFVKEWSCARDVERELGLKHSYISKCAKGKKESVGGYIWKYKPI